MTRMEPSDWQRLRSIGVILIGFAVSEAFVESTVSQLLAAELGAAEAARRVDRMLAEELPAESLTASISPVPDSVSKDRDDGTGSVLSPVAQGLALVGACNVFDVERSGAFADLQARCKVGSDRSPGHHAERDRRH